MPLTRITTNFSLLGRKAELADRLHSLMVEVLKTIEHARWIMIDERPGEFFFQPLNSEGPFAIIELSFFPGRSLETKRLLYRRVVELFQDFGVEPDNTRIVIREVERQNWGLRGGQAACDVELGFDPNV